ncbi:hypothetical protein GDI1979 [Gluconacetobacter diazotrophicus PA1 5]|uniref:Uncharacterized protein n=1 Tax=Gluconacetobacter diazotrophicus (strain ATCC 49037 / DSM 5601 / CCUG 37298 / CIP 103539 / LMG 7603 / PAl5) TaxID=272568 RepID=A9HJL5_GLUDA|nr:hypothetical protein GDI1979 [Gluconacetobacter diazotrophicus PA1 5]
MSVNISTLYLSCNYRGFCNYHSVTTYFVRNRFFQTRLRCFPPVRLRQGEESGRKKYRIPQQDYCKEPSNDGYLA